MIRSVYMCCHEPTPADLAAWTGWRLIAKRISRKNAIYGSGQVETSVKQKHMFSQHERKSQYLERSQNRRTPPAESQGSKSKPRNSIKLAAPLHLASRSPVAAVGITLAFACTIVSSVPLKVTILLGSA